MLRHPGTGRRPRRRRPVAAVAVTIGVMLATALVASVLSISGGSASADGSGSCPKEIPWCVVTGGGDGSGGGGGTSGGGGSDDSGSGACQYEGHEVACFVAGLGYYDSSDHCYYRQLVPQPAADDPIWAGHTPDEGSFYNVSCYNGPPPWGSGMIDPGVVFESGAAVGPTPLQLAEQALAKIRLDPPAIHLAPTTDGVGGLVGLPVWMWTTVSPNTWGPIGSSASFGAVTVNISGKGSSIAWNMGDGHTVTCHNPGQAYTAAAGGAKSPKCGYRYVAPSNARPNGKYAITATTTWHVDWAGGGESGVIVVTRTSRTTVRINEAQVVVK